MKITIDLDNDALTAVQEISQQKGVTMGQIVSDLVRQALINPIEFDFRNSVPLLSTRPNGEIVNMELINNLRDDS